MSNTAHLFVQLTRVYHGAEREAGQGLAEYGLIVALVAVLCVAALTSAQGGISTILNSVTGSL
ncbi:MAG TPA: Flp family type IVb pilin [Dehalococcoidia bacterium]|nr:Flp family type IVb pilin [Dehalococcoidia bacterium]